MVKHLPAKYKQKNHGKGKLGVILNGEQNKH